MRRAAARILFFIVAAACILCTSVCAVEVEELSTRSDYVSVDIFSYFELADGTSQAGMYREYVNTVQGYGGTTDLIHEIYPMRVYDTQYDLSEIKYIYVPIFTDSMTSYSWEFYIGSNNLAVIQNTSIGLSVSALNYNTSGGFTSMTSYSSTNACLNVMDNNVDNMTYIEYPNVTYYNNGVYVSETLYLKKVSINPDLNTSTTNYRNVDVLRFSLEDTYIDGTSSSLIMVGIKGINDLNGYGRLVDIDNNVTTMNNRVNTISTNVSEILTAIKNNQTANNASLTSIKTNVANQTAELEKITTQTDGDILAIQTLTEQYATIEEALARQNELINEMILTNAPAAADVGAAIDAAAVMPDVNPSTIGGGTTDSGIGIILSNDIVIKMLLCVFGVAILAYILYGKRTT